GSSGVGMIESSCEPFACVDGQIELELVAAAPGRIGPHRIRDLRAATAEVDPAAESRLDARGTVEKARKLGERDRSMVIDGARRMTFTQELRRWRDWLLFCGGGLAQIDPLSGPARPHRRQRGHDARIRIDSAQRIGVSAFRAARVKQEIVKVPENEVVVAL